MQSNKASKRYAKALFVTAKEKEKAKRVFLDCNNILTILNKEEKLNQLIKNPTIKKTIKINVFEKLFINHVGKITMDFLILVIQKGREVMIKDIVEYYKELYNIDNNITVAEVISSKKLSKDLKEAIKHKISPNREVKLTEKIDQELLGGFVVRTGDLQYDASVRKKINNVKRAFKL